MWSMLVRPVLPPEFTNNQLRGQSSCTNVVPVPVVPRPSSIIVTSTTSDILKVDWFSHAPTKYTCDVRPTTKWLLNEHLRYATSWWLHCRCKHEAMFKIRCLDFVWLVRSHAFWRICCGLHFGVCWNMQSHLVFQAYCIIDIVVTWCCKHTRSLKYAVTLGITRILDHTCWCKHIPALTHTVLVEHTPSSKYTTSQQV